MELLSKSGDKNKDYLVIGKILAAHGLRGAVKVHSISDFPERFFTLKRAFLTPDPEEPPSAPSVRVAHIQELNKGQFMITFEGITDRNAAEKLQKQFICIPITERYSLPKDTFYVADLIGFTVLNPAGEVLGHVSEVAQAMQDMIVLQTPAGTEHFIPFVKALVPDINPQTRQLTIAPVEGLLEL
jgi:16S rRNA processing protein RimM